MNLLFRLLLVLLFQSRGRTAHPLDTVVTVTRVTPNDLDLNRHVNNGRVFTLADLGRIDWFWRTGCLKVALADGTMPVIGDATGRFVKQLKLFERLTIETRLIGWGEKWAFMEHRLLRRDGELAAIVVIRGMFWSRKNGRVPVATLLAQTGHADLAAPALPDWVASWSAALDQLSESVKKPA
jgi:acyl-CoA thioesterase FadM